MDIKYKTVCGNDGIAVIARLKDRRIRVVRFNADGAYRVGFWRLFPKSADPAAVVQVTADKHQRVLKTEIELSNDAMIAMGTCIAMIGEMRAGAGCTP